VTSGKSCGSNRIGTRSGSDTADDTTVRGQIQDDASIHCQGGTRFL
jgi:hypothetical protein